MTGSDTQVLSHGTQSSKRQEVEADSPFKDEGLYLAQCHFRHILQQTAVSNQPWFKNEKEESARKSGMCV